MPLKSFKFPRILLNLTFSLINLTSIKFISIYLKLNFKGIPTNATEYERRMIY